MFGLVDKKKMGEFDLRYKTTVGEMMAKDVQALRGHEGAIRLCLHTASM